MTHTDDQDKMELALHYATNWFQIHADQRIRLMNFYIFLFAGLVTGLIATRKDDLLLVEVLIAGAMIVLTIVFKSLDSRTRSLIHGAEHALSKIEDVLAEATRIDEIKLIKAANNLDGKLSYRQAFNLIYFVGFAIPITVIGELIWPCISQPSCAL